MLEIKLQKIVGGILDKLQTLHKDGTVVEKFLALLKQQKILGNIRLSEQIFYRKQSLVFPDNEVQMDWQNKYVRYDEVFNKETKISDIVIIILNLHLLPVSNTTENR